MNSDVRFKINVAIAATAFLLTAVGSFVWLLNGHIS